MEALEESIRAYLKERSWDALRPGDVAKSISIEAAELLELFQWTNPELDAVKADLEKLSAVKKELADVLIYCLDLCVLLGVSMEAIVGEKLEQAKLKYPAHLFQNRSRTHDAGSEDLYWQIKKEHRMKSSLKEHLNIRGRAGERERKKPGR